MVRRASIAASLTVASCLAHAGALAQDAEPPPAPLPPPTLEEAEPVAPAEPLPAPPEEEEEPQVLMRIGPGGRSWQDDLDHEPVADDIAFQTPGDLRTTIDAPQGARLRGAEPEEPMPPFVLGAAIGWGRLIAGMNVDFVRLEERLEAMIPELPAFRIGAAATQMFSDQGYIVGGGVRVGLGVPLCSTGGLVCDGAAFVQPGFLAGFFGARFDLDAILTLRLIVDRVLQLSVEGGYSLAFDGASLAHLSGGAGGVF